MRFSADFSRRKDVPRIEGFVSSASATCGDNLSVTTVGSKKFDLDIFRRRSQLRREQGASAL